MTWGKEKLKSECVQCGRARWIWAYMETREWMSHKKKRGGVIIMINWVRRTVLTMKGAFYFFTDDPIQYPEGPHFSKMFYTTAIGMVWNCIMHNSKGWQRNEILHEYI